MNLNKEISTINSEFIGAPGWNTEIEYQTAVASSGGNTLHVKVSLKAPKKITATIK